MHLRKQEMKENGNGLEALDGLIKATGKWFFSSSLKR